MSEQRNCDRCNVAMTLGPLYEGSEIKAWSCPCCKSKLRTSEMISADHEKHRAKLGMTEDEYHAHCMSFVSTEPVPDEMLERLSKKVKDWEAEWEAPCEHVKNPWSEDG